MNKLDLNYVISAVGMMGVFSPEPNENFYPLYKQTTLSLMNELNVHIQNTCKHTDSSVSALFNAYTEKSHIDHFKALDNIGAKHMYADSGGLQMVTAGKSVTEEIKKSIYQIQSYADYAMCFDEIPLSSVSLTRTRNERSNVGNKLFHFDKLKDSAIATGMNIKNQATEFRRLNAKTKIIIIVQGNSWENMVEWYEHIASVLDEEDYQNIGGLAVADTCMGNGQLESIEMLIAAKKIAEICHENIKHHLHVLGVGSIPRMKPILYLIKSGYLNSYNRVSYDSSSHTSTFDYGLLKLNGTCKSIGSYKTKEVDEHFRKVYNTFSKTFSPLCTQDAFINQIFGTGEGDWKFSTIKQRALDTKDNNVFITNILSKAAHTYYQILNFSVNLDKTMSHEFGVYNKNSERAINALLNVTDDNSMTFWLSQNGKHINSKRIADKENIISIEGFLS